MRLYVGTRIISITLFGLPIILIGQVDTSIYVQSLDTVIHEPFVPLNLSFANKSVAGEERVIHWVHGLAGSSDSWKPVGPISTAQNLNNSIPNYSARKIWSEYPSYSEVSMASAVNDLHAHLETSNQDTTHYQNKSDNFIIAHSQGGLVSRGVDYAEDTDPLWNREFGGLVTFGSPHLGAQILNNGLNPNVGNPMLGGKGWISDFSEEACISLAEGPVVAASNGTSWFQTFIVQLFSIDDKLIDKSQDGCRFFGQKLVPVFMADLQPSITEDYKVGSSFVNHLSSFSNSQPKIAFYGVEEEPVFWRVTNNLIQAPEKFGPFQANDDSSYFDYKKIRNHYYTEYIDKRHLHSFHKRICDNWGWLGFGNTAQCSKARAFKKMYRGYERGLNFIDKANDKWKVIIGAIEYHSYVQGYRCICMDGTSFNTASPSDCENFQPQGEDCVSYPNVVTIGTNKDNDGVVLAESAMAMPGTISFGDGRTLMKKTNHFQMRNNKETKRVLNALFNGGFGLYFFTKAKP